MVHLQDMSYDTYGGEVGKETENKSGAGRTGGTIVAEALVTGASGARLVVWGVLKCGECGWRSRASLCPKLAGVVALIGRYSHLGA